jgi:hypothetical protein
MLYNIMHSLHPFNLKMHFNEMQVDASVLETLQSQQSTTLFIFLLAQPQLCKEISNES